jgi:hypothetical protein
MTLPQLGNCRDPPPFALHRSGQDRHSGGRCFRRLAIALPDAQPGRASPGRTRSDC